MKQLFLHLRKRQHITITSKLHTTVICNSFLKNLSEQEPSCHEINRKIKTGQITLISIMQLLTIVKKQFPIATYMGNNITKLQQSIVSNTTTTTSKTITYFLAINRLKSLLV